MWGISFQPDGLWFVFNIETGETRVKDLLSKRAAQDFLLLNKLLEL